jgi:hypothetical protein
LSSNSIKGVKALIKQALNDRLEYVTAKAIIQLDKYLEMSNWSILPLLNFLVRNFRKYLFASTVSGFGLLGQGTRRLVRGSRAG